MADELSAALRAWLDEVDARLGEIPLELAELESGGRGASQQLVAEAPHLVETVRRANKFLYAVARRRGEKELLQSSRAQLARLLEACGTQDPAGEPVDDLADGPPAAAGPQVAEVISTLLEAQEEDRRRTSIRIHDGPAQILANVMMRLEFCEKLAGKDPARAGQELREVRSELEGVLQEVRHLIFDLRPMTLDDLGLIPTLQRMVEYQKTRVPFDLQIIVRGRVRRFDREAETHMYRVVQEGLANAVAHSGARRVSVRVQLEPELVTLVVEDDGQGLAEGADLEGFGISEIRRRVGALGGEVEWKVPPTGRGCQLRARVPVAPEP